MYKSTLKILLSCAVVLMAHSLPAAAADPALQRFVGPEPETFKEPGEAVDAFKKDIDTKDVDALAKLLGLNPEAAKQSQDFDERLSELQSATKERLSVEDRADGGKNIILGDLVWPFPFPLVKRDAGWQFDTLQGLEEVLARRIGENELEAIQTCRNYIAAQAIYAEEDRDGDGVLEFAQKIPSDEGTRNGLYWKAVNGEESPASSFGDPGKVESSPKSEYGYYGYRFRILTSQGSNIAGGKYGFVINGNMIAGHALIAWPAKYGESGIMTFVVSHHGMIYEKDFGPDTDKAVRSIKSFDPDKSWEPLED